MDWLSSEDNGAGEGPDRVPGAEGSQGARACRGQRDERLGGFVPGEVWDACPPGPDLAVTLAGVGGPEWRCPGAEPERVY